MRWFVLLATAVFLAPALPSTPLLITELYANTPGDDAAEEWVELANFGPDAIPLAAYKVGDEESKGGGEGMYLFPETAVIQQQEVIVVAQSAVGFRALFGQNPTYEISDSDPTVPNMRPAPTLATGDLGLANGGDEFFVLDAADAVVDALSYGDSTAVLAPAAPAPTKGHSLERTPSHCDTDTAADWVDQPLPTPFQLSQPTAVCAPPPTPNPQPVAIPAHIPIGQVQGAGETAALLGQRVTVRGLVTGMQADQNLAGEVYYTFFMQDVPGSEDGDPATSDGLAVFGGRRRPAVQVGDEVLATGMVTEFFGLTELDDAQLELTVLSQGNPLPPAQELAFPLLAAEPAAVSQRRTYEAWEGMLVQINEARVVGATFDGCGLAVVRADIGLVRLVRPSAETDISWVTPVLYESDVACPNLPAVKSQDLIRGLSGPLTYNFDQYKIVLQGQTPLEITAAPFPPLPQPPQLAADQISVATFNVENYFDTADDTGLEAEPKATADELTLKQEKIANVIAHSLGCPTVLAVQEVENAALLQALAVRLEPACGFRYSVSHLESYDGRGIDNALLSDPRRTAVQSVQLRQSCVAIITSTGAGDCPAGQNWLFGRPPLEVVLMIDGQPLTIWVNHFKSKRGGEAASEEERLAQAEFLTHLAADVLAADSTAAFIALGDFNDYADSPTLQRLTQTGTFANALRQLPPEAQYTFVFAGVSQMIDAILLAPHLQTQLAEVYIAHVNADFPDQYGLDTADYLPYKAADHDPSLVVLNWSTVGESVAVPVVDAAVPATPLWLIVVLWLGGLSLAAGVVFAIRQYGK